MTRQAVQKHLGTLSDAGLVAARRAGREVLYRPTPAPMSEAMAWMAEVGGQWDERLAALERQFSRARRGAGVSRPGGGLRARPVRRVPARPGVAAVRALGAARRVHDRRGDRRRGGADRPALRERSAWRARPACSRSTPCALALGALGAVVLAAIGARTLWAAFRVRLGGEAPGRGRDSRAAPSRPRWRPPPPTRSRSRPGRRSSPPRRRPRWAAPATRPRAPRCCSRGVGCGTLTAFTGLSVLVALVRGRFGPRLLTAVDAVAGAGLLGFAGVLGWRTAHDA